VAVENEISSSLNKYSLQVMLQEDRLGSISVCALLAEGFDVQNVSPTLFRRYCYHQQKIAKGKKT